jgi:hypothetical protein
MRHRLRTLQAAAVKDVTIASLFKRAAGSSKIAVHSTAARDAGGICPETGPADAHGASSGMTSRSGSVRLSSKKINL